MTDSPPIDLDSRLSANPCMVLREEADRCALLFDPDSGRVYLLNETAVAIWKQLDGQRTLHEVVVALDELFDGPATAVASQVVDLARLLMTIGAVGIASPG